MSIGDSLLDYFSKEKLKIKNIIIKIKIFLSRIRFNINYDEVQYYLKLMIKIIYIQLMEY